MGAQLACTTSHRLQHGQMTLRGKRKAAGCPGPGFLDLRLYLLGTRELRHDQ